MVPAISRFFGITITMYFKDHGHPHFHAYHADGSAKVRIDNLKVIDNSLRRRQLRFVLAWASSIRLSWKRIGVAPVPVKH